MEELEKLKSLECRGNCWLNLCGYMKPWQIICRKCEGSKEEMQLINNTFRSQNQDSYKNEVINRYDFTEEEKKSLKLPWY